MNIKLPLRRRILCTVFFICFLTSAYAQEVREAGPDFAPNPRASIRAFRVEGLTQTQPSVVEPYYLPYVGRPYESFLREELIQDLRELGIFNPEIEVFPEEVPGTDGAQVDIVIVLEEKWTLLPFPFAGAASDGSLYGGVGLLETNFLGYNKKIYAMGLWATRGMQGMFGYVDPSLFGSDLGLSLTFGASVSERELVNERETLWQNYETTDISARGGFTWKLSGAVTAGVQAKYLERSVNENFESVFSPPDSARVIQAGPSFQYADLNYGSILVYGFSFRAQYDYAHLLGAEEASYHQYEASLRHHIELPDGHRLGFSASGLYVRSAPLVMESEIGGKMLKTLPEGLIADAAAAGQVSLEFILTRFSWGALTAQAAYEAGVFSRGVLREHSSLSGGTDGASYSHGPGAGVRVYLAKIALPALGVDVYYNARTGATYSSVYMGLSF
jgi:hypothetical protein